MLKALKMYNILTNTLYVGKALEKQGEPNIHWDALKIPTSMQRKIQSTSKAAFVKQTIILRASQQTLGTSCFVRALDF